MSYTLFENIQESCGALPDDSILSRTIYQDDHLKAILFGFAPGQELSEHTASVPAVIHFLSGEAVVVVGDDPIRAGAGTWIHLPPGQKHSIRAGSEVRMLLYLLPEE